MKVTFVSNFLTQHYLPFCLEMQKRLGDDFKFVSMVKIFDWRLKLGFEDLDQKYDFVVRSYESEESYNEAKRLGMESDVIIINQGAPTDELIEERLKQDKLIFRCDYRVFLFRDGFFKFFGKKNMKRFYNVHVKYRKNKNLYLLCLNDFGPKEFTRLGLYRGKTYEWGYFPPTIDYDIDKLIEDKEKNEKIRMVWVARFIKWKHPEIVLRLAKNLKSQNYDFKIQMLGTGELENEVKEKIKEQGLEDVIEVVGQVQMDKVQDYMTKANIFLGTSDSREGWGAVINESMNAGCAIVANKKMGAATFLIQEGETGLKYKNYQELETNVKKLITNKTLRQKLSKNAYTYITTKWTGKVAAENLIKQFESAITGTESNIKTGPARRID